MGEGVMEKAGAPWKILLAGNPNVGKSTLFNALTGLHQHTGNWPGKTVSMASGAVNYDGKRLELVDLPGTYSLVGNSEDQRIAAEMISSGHADCIIAVCDAGALQRTLILPLQILQRTNRVVLCINLMDEAARRGIRVDAAGLEKELGIPVVLTAAGRHQGLDTLLDRALETEKPERKNWGEDPILEAERLSAQYATAAGKEENWRLILDRLLVSRRGIPLLLLMLLLIVCLTVWGANYPSQLLEAVFGKCHVFLKENTSGWPFWLSGILVDGVFLTAARVVAVMLPPMAIFFPLFTILEDVGYLPRMAFLLDRPMCKCGGCGKQALTLCMGLGCNAVGVTGCRIIDSPRERLLAILTNAMVPCNGRFPTLILLGSLFFPQAGAALIVTACILVGVLTAMGVCGILSHTVLRREGSAFVMEMPPFRRPRIGQILVRSLFDRTLLASSRALAVAAPAGAVLWVLSNTPLLALLIRFLEPAGQLLGMDGVILLAFCLALPANELVIPVILLSLSGSRSLGTAQDPWLLMAAGWTWKTALCTMIFTLFHWPCSTTLITIYKETKSAAKTAAAFLLPTAVGCGLCLMLNLILHTLGS